jgi:hypothetical protein
LAKALPTSTDDIIGITSLAAIPCMGSLLREQQLACYRPYLLEALVTSIGAVDASLAAAASNTLVQELLLEQQQQQQEDDHLEIGAGLKELRVHVAEIILAIWRNAPRWVVHSTFPSKPIPPYSIDPHAT